MRYFVTSGAHETPVDVVGLRGGGWDVRIEGRPVAVDVVAVGGSLRILVGAEVIDLELGGAFPTIRYAAGGQRGGATVESERSRQKLSARSASEPIAEVAVRRGIASFAGASRW